MPEPPGINRLALPAGPLLGGALVDDFGWRAVFLNNMPVVAVAALAALVAVERRRGEAAMLPPDLMRRPRFAVANLAAGAMNLGTLGTLFVLTLFLQSVQHRSPLDAGVALVPLFAPLAVIAPIAGRVIGRVGERIPATAGLVLAAAGLAVLALVRPDSSYPAVLLPAFLAWGTGMGVLTPALVAAAVSAAPARRSAPGLGGQQHGTPGRGRRRDRGGRRGRRAADRLALPDRAAPRGTGRGDLVPPDGRGDFRRRWDRPRSPCLTPGAAGTSRGVGLIMTTQGGNS